MAAIGKPQVLSYGNSFAKAYGTNLEDATPKGDISRDKLNVGTLGDVGELSHLMRILKTLF